MEVPGRVRNNWTLLVVLVGPSALLIVLRTDLTRDTTQIGSMGHLVMAITVAVAAAFIAVPVVLAARRSGGGGPVLLAVGCIAVAVIMVGHGLLWLRVGDVGEHVWSDRLSLLALAVYAGTLATAFEVHGRVATWAERHRGVLLGGTVAVLSVHVGVIVADPHRATPTRYAWEDDVNTVVTATIVGLLVSAAVVNWRRWRLGGELILLALTASTAMTIAAALSLRFKESWQLSWWESDLYLFLAFVGLVVATLGRGGRSPETVASIHDAFADDPLVHISAGYPEALLALVRAVEVKDAYTYGHSKRLAELSVRLGSLLQLDVDQLRTLGRGAILHDVGKIGIPEELLNKSGEFTPDERELVEQHPELGAELVRAAPSLFDTLDVVLHHHERWDGSGYPHQLIGEEIPILARICAVADVWDALTSERVYRRAWPINEALTYMKDGAGTLFDPIVIEALIRLVDAGPDSEMSLSTLRA